MPCGLVATKLKSMSGSEISTLLSQRQQQLAPWLEIHDPQTRLARLVEEARKHLPLEQALRTEAHRVEGCLVRVWFVSEFRAGHCVFRCDSDALTLKAVGGLLCELYSGLAPRQILAIEQGLLEPLRILHLLAENRQRTIARIEDKIHGFAQVQAAIAE